MIKELEQYILDRNTPIPLYHQVKEFLKEVHCPPTHLILRCHQNQKLSIHFSISRPTVRQAIASLASEGYIYKIQGKGTFVAKKETCEEFHRLAW